MDRDRGRRACEIGKQRCNVYSGRPRGTRRRRIMVGYGTGEEEDCRSPSSRLTESRFLDSGVGLSLSSSGYRRSTIMR
jgi:hypothetical protein